MENTTLLNEVNKLIDEILKMRFYDSIGAKDLCEKAINICQENNFEKEKAICFSLFGNIYHFLSKYSEGMEYLLNSITIFEKYDMHKAKADAYRWMGNICFDLNDYENAFDYYFKTLEIEEKAPNNASKASALNNIGEIYKYLKDYEKAREYYFRSYEIDKKNNLSVTEGTILINISDIHYILGEYNEALKYAKEALELMANSKKYYAIPEVYKDLAQIYFKLNEIDLAKENYELALESTKKYQYYFLQIEVLLSYADFLKETQCNEKAIELLLMAYNISLNQGNLTKIKDVCYNIATIYEKTNIEEAYKYYKLFAKYEKSIEENRCKEISRSISIRNKLNLMKKEKETLQSEKETLENTINTLSIIEELGQKIASTTVIYEIIQHLLSAITKFFQLDCFGIAFLDEMDKSINYYYYIERGEQLYLPSTSIDNKGSFAAYCLRNNEILVVNDIEKEYKKYINLDKVPNVSKVKEGKKFNSILYCPLVFNNNKIGVLTIQSYDKDFFSEYYIRIIKAISSYASIALTNAKSSLELKKEIKLSEELNEKLNFLAENDELTGISNRRSFDRYIEEIWQQLSNTRKNLSMILIDIDYFKEFNDNYGHVEGDNCLCFIAGVLKDSVKDKFYVSRYGGDEFCIILPDTDKNQSLAFAEYVRKLVEKKAYPHEFSMISNNVTISLGVATVIPSKNETMKNLLIAADEALYNAKKIGRNRAM